MCVLQKVTDINCTYFVCALDRSKTRQVPISLLTAIISPQFPFFFVSQPAVSGQSSGTRKSQHSATVTFERTKRRGGGAGSISIPPELSSGYGVGLAQRRARATPPPPRRSIRFTRTQLIRRFRASGGVIKFFWPRALPSGDRECGMTREELLKEPRLKLKFLDCVHERMQKTNISFARK